MSIEEPQRVALIGACTNQRVDANTQSTVEKPKGVKKDAYDIVLCNQVPVDYRHNSEENLILHLFSKGSFINSVTCHTGGQVEEGSG